MKRTLKLRTHSSLNSFEDAKSMASTQYDKFSEVLIPPTESTSSMPFSISEIKQLIRNQVCVILLQIKEQIEIKVKEIDRQIKQIKNKYATKQEMDQRVIKIENKIEEMRKRGALSFNQDQLITSKNSLNPLSANKSFNNGINLSEILFPFGNTFIKEPEEPIIGSKPLPKILEEDFLNIVAGDRPQFTCSNQQYQMEFSISEINPLEEITESFVQRVSHHPRSQITHSSFSKIKMSPSSQYEPYL